MSFPTLALVLRWPYVRVRIAANRSSLNQKVQESSPPFMFYVRNHGTLRMSHPGHASVDLVV
jgi:hypothetical protein